MHRRTALITAGSIVAVVLTGATAVGANIGILSSAAASDVGDLTAVTEVATEIPTVEIATVAPTSSPSSAPTSTPVITTQTFVADAAGTVDVRFGNGTVRLGSVDAGDGWTWTSNQASDGSLQVSFVSADGQELEFFADVLPDGTLSARVDETVIETVQGEPEVITVHQQATAVPVAPTSPPATLPPVGVQPANTTVPVPAQAAATAVPLPTAASAPTSPSFTDDDRWDDDWDDHDEDREDDWDDDRDDDEHEYEGADDDD